MVKHGDHEYLCSEEKRLKEDKERKKYWKRWGPYLSEWVCPPEEGGRETPEYGVSNEYRRQWGTVREDYS
jgi:hypothetical protein